jgi:hypothetical protein
MAIQYVGGQTAGRTNASAALQVNFALTGGLAATPAEGDLVVVTCVTGSAGGNPTMAVTTPAGYSNAGQINQSAVTADTSIDVSVKFMGASPDTSVTIPGTTNNAWGEAYAIQVFRGVDAAIVDVPVAGVGGTATGRPDPASVTPTTAGAWILVCGGGAAGTGANYIAPANYTSNFLTSVGADTTDAMVGCGYRSDWASGAENPAAYTGGTTGANDSWGCFTLALRPASTPAITGTLNATETGSDTASASANVVITASASATESGSDSFAATVQTIQAITASMAAVESGSDKFSAPVASGYILTDEDLVANSKWNDPNVIYENNGWTMFASCGVGFTGEINIYRLRSTDRTTWTLSPNTPVLVKGTAGQWDDGAVETPSVVYYQGAYHMFYTGYPSGGQSDSKTYKIGRATSADGISWTKDASYLLAPTDPTNPTPTMDFRQWVCAEPGAIVVGASLYLYFSALGADAGVNTTLQTIGVSIYNGSSWGAATQVLKPDQPTYPRASYYGYSTPQPCHYNGRIGLFFSVVADPWKQVFIANAFSANGTNTWTLNEFPVIGREFAWRSNEVLAPSPLQDDQGFHLWFAGNNGTNLSIGYTELSLGDISVRTSASAALQETGSDTMSVTANVTVAASVAAAEGISDVFSATAQNKITGTLTVAEVGADSFAATSEVRIGATLAAQEIGPDTFSGSVGAAPLQSTMAAQETGSDTFAASAGVVISATVFASEVGADSFAATAGAVVAAALAASETGADSFSASALNIITAAITVIESSSDVFAASTQVRIAANMSAAEEGSDQFGATIGQVPLLFEINVQETGQDTVAASAVVVVTTQMSAQENGSDSFASDIQLPISVTVSVTESGADGFVAGVQALIAGQMVAFETGSDTFVAYLSQVEAKLHPLAGYPLYTYPKAGVTLHVYPLKGHKRTYPLE